MSSKKELSFKEEAELIYGFIADFLSARNWQEKKGRKMNDTALAMLAIMAGLQFSGNYQKALKWALDFPDLFPSGVLSKSRLSRRLKILAPILAELQEALSTFLTESKKKAEEHSYYIIDSFPVSICHIVRKSRCKIVEFIDYLGYNASKKERFYGQKVQMITNQYNIPVTIYIHPGSYHDMSAFSEMPISLPVGSELFADKGYNSQAAEEKLKTEKGIKPMFLYRKNIKRANDDEKTIKYKQKKRKPIETTFSQITGLFPKKIHAINLDGFETKIRIFILAYTFKLYFNNILLQ